VLSRAAQRHSARRRRAPAPGRRTGALGLSAPGRGLDPGKRLGAVGTAWHPGGVDVTAADIEGIPAENLHVSRADFAALWIAAERFHDDCVRRQVPDWYGAGVVVTCLWISRATVRPTTGPWRPAESPVTERTNMAYAELVEAEALAAEVLEMRQPRPGWLTRRPGWIEGIAATLRWVWLRTGGPPIDVGHSATG
jgi:hypothetical protein